MKCYQYLKYLVNYINYIKCSQVRKCLYIALTLSEIQYCAKVMKAKCVNFSLCSCELSLKVRATIPLQFFTKFPYNKERYFVKVSLPNESLTKVRDEKHCFTNQCSKFCVRQTQQFSM